MKSRKIKQVFTYEAWSKFFRSIDCGKKVSELLVITRAKDLLGHLKHGHTFKLRKKVLSEIRLVKRYENEV